MSQKIFPLLALACFATWSLTGQSTTSQITGIVRDPTNAVIANAQVTIANLDTGIERTVSSNELGYYTIALLLPGNYKITCQREGFRQLTRSGLTLAADQVSRVDLTLELGDVTQTVVVQENVTLVQTDRPESSMAMTTTQFDRLPLIQQNRMRNPVGFVYMTPRVQGNVVPDGSDNVGATTQMRFGGGQQFESEVTVDGVVGGRTQLTGSITEAAPPVDAVREFKVTNSLMSAEWGHTGIGVVNLQLKSGTNQFHGTAFEYSRNDKLDARSWLAPTRTVTRQNEFGVTFGGPFGFPRSTTARTTPSSLSLTPARASAARPIPWPFRYRRCKTWRGTSPTWWTPAARSGVSMTP